MKGKGSAIQKNYQMTNPAIGNKIHWTGWIILLLVISYIPIFFNLEKAPIRMWDEAIYANNALEMAVNHDFLVLHNNGVPNLYNTKPPLVIWLQTLCITRLIRYWLPSITRHTLIRLIFTLSA